MDELRAISVFVRAAELGSFNKVALAQGTTPQAVSKTVRLLEHQLGVRLIHRTTRRSALTEDGQRLFDSVKRSLDELVAAVERVRNSARHHEGVIRVGARTAIGRRILLPLVAEFRQQHPAIEFDLVLEEREVDFISDRLDVSLVAGEQPSTRVIARKLFPIQQVVCASPKYLWMHSMPMTPGELVAHRCTGHRRPGMGKLSSWDFGGSAGRTRQTVPLVLCCSDPEAEMQAVLAGIGIGRIDSITAVQNIRNGQLVPLLTDWAPEDVAMHLCYAQRADMPARVRLFIDFAMAKLKDSAEFSLSRDELRAHGLEGLRHAAQGEASGPANHLACHRRPVVAPLPHRERAEHRAGV